MNGPSEARSVFNPMASFNTMDMEDTSNRGVGAMNECCGGESSYDTKSPSRIRRRGWLSGLGLRSSSSASALPVASPSLPSPQQQQQRRASAIADDIRNDHNLFFLDDDMPSNSSRRMSTTAGPRCVGGGGSQFCIRESRSATHHPGMPRRSSAKKLESLQREVNFALEFFHQEAENEGSWNDSAEHLRRNMENYPRMEADHRCPDYGSFGDDYDESLPETDATSNSTSVVSNYESGPMSDAINCSAPSAGIRGLSLAHKTKSILSFPLSLLQSYPTMNSFVVVDDTSSTFHNVVADELTRIRRTEEQIYRGVEFNTSIPLRNAMEPFLAAARLRREEARQGVFDTLEMVIMNQGSGERARQHASASSDLLLPIASNYGVPYPALRNESSFLYDVDSFPLDSILANALGVEDLSKIHIDHPSIEDKGRLLAALQNPDRRRQFHRCFDSFVTSQVIPLLHTQALSKGIFYTNRYQLQKVRPQSIIYRYQAFPNISIVRPGECAAEPHCEISQGHSIGNICYHIPLTPSFGTNALYTESHPGREDWHPLLAKSPGLGFQFDGSRCLHFNPRNETEITQVSLNFRIAITRAPDCHDIAYDPDDQLCCLELLKDKFSYDNPGFYDEIAVAVGETPTYFMPRSVSSKGEIMVIG